ncbi:MAG TPA: flagellum-specific ATP synthase FliI, partial [Herminiimonas sp.]|nr:flagellum-specific ATP synthase FliI [Herminiimonas sp.]
MSDIDTPIETVPTPDAPQPAAYKPAASNSSHWQAYLRDCGTLVDIAEPMLVSGRVTRVAGLVMEAVGLKLAVGSACTIPLPNGTRIEAEVVGFDEGKLFLMP